MRPLTAKPAREAGSVFKGLNLSKKERSADFD
jgi:hypothetical protein